jgi:hypothetical protein
MTVHMTAALLLVIATSGFVRTEALSDTLARDRAALRQKYRRAGRAG